MIVLQSKVYSKTEGKEKKKEQNKIKNPKQALEKGPVNHAKQREEGKGKEWRHPGNNPGMKAEGQTLAGLWRRNFLYLSASVILGTAVPSSWAGTLTHCICQKKEGKWEKCEEWLY